MGQTLSEPVTEKHTESGADDRYAYAVSEMQGWRVSMEDAHTTLLRLENDSNDAFFAVFDGHGGSSVAKFAGSHVAKRLTSEQAYRETNYKEALKKAFLGTDEDLRADPSFFHDPSGCTAVAALITGDRKLLVANAGDSRSVLSCAGLAKPMSYDHKPTNEKETQRIVAAGGFVEYGRVNGNLALSRAIGDFEFKSNHGLAPEQQIVTADPDIIEHQLTDEEEFLVLACDGIWDCLSSQQVIDIVRRLLAQRKPLTEIVEFTIQKCCAPDSDTGAGIGCDNMTMIVLIILNGRTIEQYYDWIAERVEKKVGYETPEDFPQIFAESRILAAQQRAAFRSSNGFNGGGMSLKGPAGISAFARILGGGGISFNPGRAGGAFGGGFLGGGGGEIISFDGDEDEYEDDEDYEDEDLNGEGGMFGVNRLKVGNAAAGDSGKEDGKSLHAQLVELEDGIEEDEQEARRHEEQKAQGQPSATGISSSSSTLRAPATQKQPSSSSDGDYERITEDDTEMKDDFVPVEVNSVKPDTPPVSAVANAAANTPRADIHLPSPSERQGIINLDAAASASSAQPSSPPRPSHILPKAFKLSDPTTGAGSHNTSATGSPLVPSHDALASLAAKGNGPNGTVSKGTETPPPGPPGVDNGSDVPAQQTGRVPDADAKGGKINGLLDKSEDPLKA